MCAGQQQLGDTGRVDDQISNEPGLIKADEEVLGVLFKGVGRSFDQNAFSGNLIDGKFIHFPDSGYAREIVLSRVIANKIKAKPGDEVTIHFFQTPPRFRKLLVTGIYETNLSDYFDSKVIIGDIRLIQRLNDWPDSLVGGLEIFVNDTRRIDETYEQIGESMDFDLFVEKVTDRYIQVFEWLGLVSRQVNILLGIIIIVVCVNMISVILILVMERTQMIGLLKAMGAQDDMIRSVFVRYSANCGCSARCRSHRASRSAPSVPHGAQQARAKRRAILPRRTARS